MRRRVAQIPALLFALTMLPAMADGAEEAALRLTDQEPTEAEPAGDWKIFVEAGLGDAALRDGASQSNQRLSLDIRMDKALAPGWRAIFADRIDLNRHANPGRERNINTLKEAWLSWQPEDDRLLDLGRINVRNGVATGYNPTDYFRDRANRSIISADPGSQKRNRQGSVMLRGQRLWKGGSLTALYSPKLASQPNPATWNPDLGATNNRDRWLLALGTRVPEKLDPQWLLYDEEGKSPQLGVNLATLLNDATVSYVEWSGGRSRSLLSQALNGADDSAFRNRLATGITWTAPNKLSLTLELQYNGAGMREAEWKTLPQTAPSAYGRYRRSVQSLQEMPTREAVFFYGSWQDAMVNRLDLNAMLRFNAADHSRLSWLEARYHWDRSELALQWQHNSGSAASEFGASPQRRVVQAVARYFF